MSEILGVLFGLLLGLMGMAQISSSVRAQQHLQTNIATGMQQQDWVQGVSDYTTSNMSTLLASATATSPVVINLATLQAAGVTLPSGFNGTNPYNQTWVAEALQPTAGHLQVLVYAIGGTSIADKDLGAIVRNAGGVGGMIPSNDSGAYPGAAANAYGAYGSWKIATTNYTNVVGGHPASLLNFSNGALTSNYLYRNAVPGQPQLNQMNTDLGMNGHNITNVGRLQTAGGNGVQVGSSFLYGDTANSAIRQNGGFYVQNQAGTAGAPIYAGNINSASVSANGNVSATGAITAGSTITAGGSAGIGGNLTVSGNAQVNGALTANGQVTAGGNVVANGAVVINTRAAIGAGCATRGAMAQASNGTGEIVQCKNSKWTAMGADTGSWHSGPTSTSNYSATNTTGKLMFVALMVNGQPCSSYRAYAVVDGLMVGNQGDYNPDYAKYGSMLFPVEPGATWSVIVQPYNCATQWYASYFY